MQMQFASGDHRCIARVCVGTGKHRAGNGVCTGARDGAMARVEFVTGPEWWRRCSDWERAHEIVCRAAICPGQIYPLSTGDRGGNRFAQVVIAPVEMVLGVPRRRSSMEGESGAGRYHIAGVGSHPCRFEKSARC